MFNFSLQCKIYGLGCHRILVDFDDGNSLLGTEHSGKGEPAPLRRTRGRKTISSKQIRTLNQLFVTVTVDLLITEESTVTNNE